MDSKAYWVGFNLVKGIGAVRLRQIIDFFGTLEIAWNSPKEGLLAAGLSSRIADNFQQVRSQINLDLIMANIEKKHIKVLTWEDSDYPRRLKEINQAPPVIFVNGSINVEDDWAVAVVGTRRVTPYGRQVTAEIARFLAQNGVTVVSGLARGVDAIAHQTALQTGGRTIAVLGNGVDVVYPTEHRKLASEIASQGALVSDYALGTPPDGVNFPPRNRIISGLSLATVVVEAGETSGALITAEFAVEQGRDVFAVPGSILTPQSEGTNRLIEQGARPLLKMAEILDALKLEQIPEKQLTRKINPTSGVEKNILNCLSQDPMHVDELCSLSGLPISEVSATLTMLELKGMVTQVGGMHYVVARDIKGLYKTK
ncbi:MAG: DNA-protecting protein DprA [Chloroflexi bacterium HGW-Chloroflexi-4]|nr:MAG: DNA-protecting protein DprA [Chloroflexi bacterium HGW-Chloroflexi-4]